MAQTVVVTDSPLPTRVTKTIALSDTGRTVLEIVSSEFRLWAALPETGDVERHRLFVGRVNSKAVGEALRNKWITVRKDGAALYISRRAAAVVDTVRGLLVNVRAGIHITRQEIHLLRMRKLIMLI